MKKIAVTFFALFFAYNFSYSQGAMDFGISLGGANYTGEVGGNSTEAQPWLLDMQLGQTSYAMGGFYRYNITGKIAAKLSINYARIRGADSLSTIKTQLARNIHFRTDIIEAVVTGEYTFYSLNDISRSATTRVDFGSYVFGGAGVALFYPYAEAGGKWYYLRPLQTEGTENAYNEMTIALPFGAGAHFTFNKKIRLGIEFGYRFTFTDYLDDVSTDFAYDSELPFEESKLFSNRSDAAFARGEAGLPDRGFFVSGSRRGNPDTNDGYLLGQISISYVIGGSNSFYKSKYNSIINRRRKRTKF